MAAQVRDGLPEQVGCVIPKYEVEICVDGNLVFVVEAEDEKEAKSIALDKAWEVTDDYAYLEAYRPKRVE